MMRPLFLGLDIGTQSVRAVVIDEQGICHGYGVRPLDTTYPHPGWAEQDARQWWQAVCGAVPEALSRAGITNNSVAAIGLDCTACTVIPCSLDATPLTRALLWMDQRAHREAAEISATGDSSLRYVSGVVSPEWMLPKALWLKRHRPELYARTERMVECTDWLMYRLTGSWTLSLNHVAVKWNYVRPEGGWSQALLHRVGLEDLAEKWPQQIVPLGQGQGRLTATAAEQLGLREGIPVAQGGIDAYLGMLGLGAVGAGDLAMIVGSSTCHLATSPTPVLGSGMLGCFPDAVSEGLYTLEGGQTSTGSILDWYRRHFAGTQQVQAERTGRAIWELLDEEAAGVPPGCDGLLCLDSWQGNRCPLKDPQARGAWVGLTLSHGTGHLYRSLYEATACGTRHILDDLRSHGFQVQRIFAGGGGVRSRLWMQIHADVLDLPIHLPAESEACALGAALVAATHSGYFNSLKEAAASMVRLREIIEPQPSTKAIYKDLYERYRKLYPALRPLMRS